MIDYHDEIISMNAGILFGYRETNRRITCSSPGLFMTCGDCPFYGEEEDNGDGGICAEWTANAIRFTDDPDFFRRKV